MHSKFEETLIAHCAPTLAGHKCGSLFSYRHPGQSAAEVDAEYAACEQALAEKGVSLLTFKRCSEGRQVYVYRPAALGRRLMQPDVQAFLAGYGYSDFGVQACLELLGGRIRCGEDFPHEIGIFLDYPLSDVIGFIQHGGANCRCSGCWKAYADEENALRRFALYRKCKSIYLGCYRRGIGISRLTVAAA